MAASFPLFDDKPIADATTWVGRIYGDALKGGRKFLRSAGGSAYGRGTVAARFEAFG